MTILARSFVATLLSLMLSVWLLAIPNPAGAGEHFPRALGILTTEQEREAPDFSLRDSAGKVHRLRDYRGKVVLLGFGATW